MILFFAFFVFCFFMRIPFIFPLNVCHLNHSFYALVLSSDFYGSPQHFVLTLVVLSDFYGSPQFFVEKLRLVV